MADSDGGNNRVILNARSFYSSVNYTRPLLCRQNTVVPSSSASSVPASSPGLTADSGFSTLDFMPNLNTSISPQVQTIRNLNDYVEAILLLLLDIISYKEISEGKQHEIRGTYTTPNLTPSIDLGVSDEAKEYSSCLSVSGSDAGRAHPGMNSYQIYFNTCASKLHYQKQVSTLDRMWIVFLDAVASLQNIDILRNVPIHSVEALAIWLNIFHILQLHGMLVFGSSKSKLSWVSHFRSVSYEAFGDVFSLCELEHNIIAAGLSRPRAGPIADLFLLPKEKYPFRLHTNDIRLHFVLNRGAKDQLKSVPVYKPGSLGMYLLYQ